MKKYIYTFLISSLFLISCDKYLDVQPKGVRLLQTVRDYDEWLNNMDLETSTPQLLNWLDDRKDLATLTAAAAATSANERIFTWQAQAVETVLGAAPIWMLRFIPMVLGTANVFGVRVDESVFKHINS